MEQNIYFSSYNQGIITLTPSGISKAMYKEASAPGGYDYRDPITGLSFQLVGTTRAFVCDPDCPVVSQILTAQWQIIYDATYSGIENVKFVAKGLDNTVSTNWKSINDVLQVYNWTGTLPVVQLSQVYMGVFNISESLYVVGTLFTPSQPYVRVVVTGTQTVATNAEARIQFNSIDDQVGTEEGDSAQIVPVITGTNAGVVRLKVAGLYLVEADASINVTAATVARLTIKVNGAIRKLTSFTIPATGGDNPFNIGTIRIKRSDLADVTFPDEAKLEVTLTNTSSASATLTSGGSELTALTVTFLG